MASSSDSPPPFSEGDSSFENIDQAENVVREKQPNPIVDALLDNLFKQNRAKVAEGEQPAEGLKDKKEKSEAKKKAKIDKEMRAAHEKTKHYMIFAACVVVIFSISMTTYKEMSARALDKEIASTRADIASARELLKAVRVHTRDHYLRVPINFPRRRRVNVIGVPRADASGFTIDLVTDERKGATVLHFNASFAENAVILNDNNRTFYQGFDRNQEERPKGFPFKRTEMFDIEFYSYDDVIMIYVNDRSLSHYFKKRSLNFDEVVDLRIGGDVDIYGIKQKDVKSSGGYYSLLFN